MLDAVPLWILFLGTVLLVLGSTEFGYRAGRAAQRAAQNEKSSVASGASGAVLGLAAFMLAFAFGSVASRFDARKELVREDANAIRTAWVRADFLPDADRAVSKRLLERYLDERIAFSQKTEFSPEILEAQRHASETVLAKLWNIAVANARKDMNSDVAALYIESLNDVASLNANRIAVGGQLRLPSVVWGMLLGLTAFGMMGIGYHTGIDESPRSRVMIVVALAFATVIVMLAALDRPHGLRVTQQPLLDLRDAITVATNPSGR
jgi:hypothetical protein